MTPSWIRCAHRARRAQRSTFGAALGSDTAVRRDLETRVSCAPRVVYEPLLHPRFHQVETCFLRPAHWVIGRRLEKLRRFFPLLTSEVNPSQAVCCNAHVGLKLHRLTKLLRCIDVLEIGRAHV